MKYGSFRYCIDCNMQKVKHQTHRARLGYLLMALGIAIFAAATLFGSEPFALASIGAIVARETSMMLYSCALIVFSMMLLISSR